MINDPALRLLRNSEFIRYQKNVLKICRNSNAETLRINDQVAILLTAVTALDNLFMVQRANLNTEELVALDLYRDKALIGLRSVAEGYAQHYDVDIAKAGTAIIMGMDKYGTGISRFNYMAETEVVESLVKDFKNDTVMHAAMGKLGLKDWVNELGRVNEQFDDTYIARNKDYAGKPLDSLSRLRVTATEKYDQLMAHITAHATLTPSDAYTELVNELNSLTDRYGRMIASRGSHGELPESLEEAIDDAPTDALS